MIKAIVFDCFGVLTTDTWRAFLDSLPPGTNIEQARELNRAFDAGFLTEQEYLDQVEEVTGYRPPEIEKLFRGEVVKNVPLLNYIRELKPHFSIGLLSNISSNWIRTDFLTEEEQLLFDEMVLSYEVGMVKPDPRIFMLICERLRVGPHETVLVDDSKHYIAAAEAEGLKGAVYTDLNTLKTTLNLLTNSNDDPLIQPA